MSFNIYTPYTYLIGWSNLNRYYYGVRYSSKCHPSDLWVNYFTSSKHVKEYAKINGSPDIIKIRKIFNDSQKARIWENRVLKRMNVIKDKRFLNMTDNISISKESSMKGSIKPKSEQMKRKLSQTRLGKSMPTEIKKKISATKSGVPLSTEAKEKIKLGMNKLSVRKKLSDIGKTKTGQKNNFYGKTHTEETKKQISASKKGKPAVNRKPIMIDGIWYESIKNAREVTGLSKHKIYKMLNN